jgi:uncharacterized membrane protein YgcG
MGKTNLLKRLFIFVALLFCIALSFAVNTTTYAATEIDSYSFEISRYDLVYDIKADRTMHVTENVTIRFTGALSTGFYRDIPINDGDRIKNVKVYDGETLEEAEYDVTMEDLDFITLDIGDYTNKTGRTYTYIIEYDYEMTKPADKNVIYLNAVGFGTGTTIRNITMTLNLPEGLKGGRDGVKYYINAYTTSSSNDFTLTDDKVITASIDYLTAYNGATFALTFEDGVLSTRFDPAPLILAIIAAVIIAALLAVKFLVFNKHSITPIVNFEPPEGMDPLVMGKLIDNKVNTEDVTSLIYYWANKGYIKINLDDKDDPQFIRIFRELPEGTPTHQLKMYHGMFGDRDEVKLSQLENKFYPTVEAVTKDVNSSYKALYESKSMGISIVFALLGALILGLAPTIIAMINISSKLFLYESLVMLIPAFIIYALVESLMYYKLKMSNKKFTLCMIGIFALCAIISLLYIFVLPSAIMELSSKIIACVAGFIIIILSVTIISRTEDYTQKLNGIVGFRNFILYTEKDRLEAMLEEDPQFYYHILPYAQVLGVTDKWQNKFDSMVVEPPAWSTHPITTYIQIATINYALRNMNAKMVTKMTSRPASSGRSGGFGGGGHGGSFGGFGGGGHGGGGFRGR